MGIEFEVKFRATPAIQETIRKGIPEQEAIYAMQTTYYDTPGGDLAKRMYTLRRRMENTLSVCTLKTPADGLGRREFEVNCENIEDALEELCRLSGITELPALFSKGLIPVCGAAFTRIAKALVLEGCTVELALDKGILSGGGKQLPLCEIEVELKSGSREAALAYAQKLAKTYGLTPEAYSKFQRAQALAKGV